MFEIKDKKEFITLLIAVGAFVLSIFNFVSQRSDRAKDYKFKMAQITNEQIKKEDELIEKIGLSKINAVRIVNKCDETIWVSTKYSSITGDIITRGEDAIMPNDTLQVPGGRAMNSSPAASPARCA